MQEGDVVLAVNNTRVSTPAQLKDLLDHAGKRFALLVQREDARLYVPVRVD
ncbi:MAG TPA: PDZ domain-containing protein [Azospira sp.]|nr:PDZ domain-containing protein [Azospira sp.]